MANDISYSPGAIDFKKRIWFWAGSVLFIVFVMGGGFIEGCWAQHKAYDYPVKWSNQKIIESNYLNCNFNEGLDISNCIFGDQVQFSQGTFKKRARFYKDTFQNETYFSTSNFLTNASFINVEFQRLSSFQQVSFKTMAYFFDIDFEGEVNFLLAKFQDMSFFDRSNFRGYADFEGANFDSSTSFYGANFFKKPNFRGVHVNDKILFFNTVFWDSIDFSHVTNIAHRIDFTYSRTDTIKKPHAPPIRYINLTNTDVSKIKIDYLHFHLYFDKDATYEQRSLVYNSLLKNFENDGFTDSYELLDKEYKDFKYDHAVEIGFRFLGRRIILPKFLSPYFYLKYLDFLWWDYGYSKGLIFIWIIVSMLTFTVLTHLWYPKLSSTYHIENIHPRREITDSEKRGEVKYEELSFLQKWYVAFLYTAIIFFSLNIKINKMNWRPKRYAFYLMLVYTFGLVCLGYTVNFVLQK